MAEFKCKRCGKCCGIVPFDKKEYAAIRDYARKKHIGFTKTDLNGKTVYFPKHVYEKFLIAAQRAEEEGRLLDNEVDDLQCPFLEFDENGLSRCAIYEHRPEICRLFGKGGHPFLTCPNNPLVDISEH